MRWRPHFTIRDVLWLTVVVGLACALVLEHRRAEYWARVMVVYAHEVENPNTSFDEWLKMRQSDEFREEFGDLPLTVPIFGPPPE